MRFRVVDCDGQIEMITMLNEPGQPAIDSWTNGTRMYSIPHHINGFPQLEAGQRFLYLKLGSKAPKLFIVGRTDNANAETAVKYMLAEVPRKGTSLPCVIIRGIDCDFRAAGSRCFSHMFEVVKTRDVQLFNLTMSAQQSAVLATASHPIVLMLTGCKFEDRGTAFVDAIEKRQTPFGSLTFPKRTGLSDDNLKRLLQVGMLNSLSLFLLGDEKLTLLPFATKADSLVYDISSASLLKADFEGLNIAPTSLSLTVHHAGEGFPTEHVLSFLQRVADVGHFVRLRVRIKLSRVVRVPDCVAQELVRATLANCGLTHLDICGRDDSNAYWDPHLRAIFEGVKNHPGLCTVAAYVYDEKMVFGDHFSYLRQFLAHNRYIRVTNAEGAIHTDGYFVDKLYELNAIYRGSKDLGIEPPPERPSLVTNALVTRASTNFQYSALLLSNHADALCEIVQFANVNGLDTADSSSQSNQGTISKRNRGRKARGRRDARRK